MTTCFKLSAFLPKEVCEKLARGSWKNAVDGMNEARAWNATYRRVAMQMINVEMCRQIFDTEAGVPTKVNLTDPVRRGRVLYSVNGLVSGHVAVRGNNFGNIYVPYGWDKTAVEAFIERISRALAEILDAPATSYGVDVGSLDPTAWPQISSANHTLGELLYEMPNVFFPRGYRRVPRVCTSSTQCQIIVVMPKLKLREFVYDAKDDSQPSSTSYMTWSIVEQSREAPIPHMGRLAQNTQSYLNSIVIDQYNVFNVKDGESITVCLSKKHTNLLSETGVMDRPVIAPIGPPAALVPSGDKFRDQADVKFSQHEDIGIKRSGATPEEIAAELIDQSWTVEQQDRSKLEFKSKHVCINCQGLVAGRCYAFKIANTKTNQWRVMHPICAHLAGMSSILKQCYSEFAEFDTPVRSKDLLIEFTDIDNAALLMVSESHFDPQIKHSKAALLELDDILQVDLFWAQRGIVVTPNYIFADSKAIVELIFRDELVYEINEYYHTPGKFRTVIQCFIVGISPPDPENN